MRHEASARQRQLFPPRNVWHLIRPASPFAEEMAPFFAEHGELVFNHEARQAQHTRITETSPRTWDVTQVLVDPEGDNLWFIDALVDLRDPESFEKPLLRLRRIGT